MWYVCNKWGELMKQMYKQHPGLFKFSIFIFILTAFFCTIYAVDAVQKYNRQKSYVGESLLTPDELIKTYDVSNMTQDEIDNMIRSNRNGEAKQTEENN
jgi:flagellar biosynthesis protein FliP